jgi:hypothetical protein
MYNHSVILISIVLILTGFTHFWNPIGFPHPNVDEGIYLGRAAYIEKLLPKFTSFRNYLVIKSVNRNKK